jgi:hypothetical protein
MNAQPQRVRAHRKTALALVITASLLSFVAIFALWANRQLLDTNNWVDTSDKLIQNSAIRNQTAAYLSDQLNSSGVIQKNLEQALPPRAQGLAGPIASGIQDVSDRVIRTLLERPRFERLWEEANRRAHKAFLHVVEGGNGTVSTANGDVTLDLHSLLGQAQGPVAGKVQSVLPASAGQLTILHSDQLSLAQDLVNVLRKLAIVLIVVALGLFALAVYLARGWRREALRATGIGLLVGGLLAVVARALGGSVVVNSLASTESIRPAIQAAWGIGTGLLVEAAVATIAYGVVIIVSAWLAGPTAAAVATRRSLAPYLREPAFAFGGLAVIVLLVAWWGPTPATRNLITGLVLIALLVFGVEMLRRQTAREFPDASREAAAARRREAWARWRGSRRGAQGRRPFDAEPDDRLRELEQLGRLREAGVLDAQEFEREKRRILASGGAVTSQPA